MPSLMQMNTDARLLADEPRPQKPSLRRTLLAVLQATQTFYARLGNTGQAWSLKPDLVLGVVGNQQDFLLPIDDTYGKPIQVLTHYPQAPSYVQRHVEFREFSDMNFDWPYPVNLSSWVYTDGSNCTAARMAFFNKDDGSRWVRVLPRPQLAAQYLITFASGDWASGAGFEDSPTLTQFHSLIETWAAQSFLPSCEWWEDQNLNQAHRKELFVALKNDEARLSNEFDAYCRNLVEDFMAIRNSSFDGVVSDGGGWY